MLGQYWRYIRPEIAYLSEYRLRKKGRVKEIGFQLLKKKRD